MSTTEREAFERWLDLERPSYLNDRYEQSIAQRGAAWEAWQARAPQPQQPAPAEPAAYGVFNADDTLLDAANTLRAAHLIACAAHGETVAPLYRAAAAVQPPVLPLTEEEIDELANDGCRNAAGGIYATSVYEFARAIEARLMERRNGK